VGSSPSAFPAAARRPSHPPASPSTGCPAPQGDAYALSIDRRIYSPHQWGEAELRTVDDLARVLRELRRRHARRTGGAELTYRELAAATGWSHGIVGEYLTGRILPPTGRFDALIRLLGATPAEQGVLATARDRIEEDRRHRVPSGVPRQLPADVFGFTGRASQLDALDAFIDGGPRLAAVTGTAGVGKTALVVHWAHRVAGRFPDGQLYVDLRGYDPGPPVAAADALAGFLRRLGVGAGDIASDSDERAAQFRTVLADRRVLVVLDNAASADHVRPLLPGTPSCLAVVTSRDALSGLVARDGARRLGLDALTDAEAVDLLRTLVGGRVDADPGAATALAGRCAHLPLALRIAAEFATTRPGLPLADLATDLHDEQARLDLLEAAGDPRTAVRSAFSWSYRHLSPDGQQVFARLGLHPGREMDAYAVAALAGTGLAEARTLLAELGRAHLIEPAGETMYRMHDLLRAYAVEQAADCPEPEAALTRLFDHYLGAAAAAMDALFPHERQARPKVAQPPTPQPALDEAAAATRWLDEQRSNLVAVARHAATHGWAGHSVNLSRMLWRHLEVGGHYQEALAVHDAALAAAESDAASGLPAVLTNLGGIHWWLGNHEEARAQFERAISGYRELDDPDGRARAFARLALVHERLGDYRKAMAHITEALAGYQRTGNRHGEGSQLVNLGTLYRRLGRYAEAAEHQRRAAAVFVALGDRRLEGYALGNLAAVESLLGQHDEALAHLTQALTHCRESGDRGGEGSALGTIGAVYGRQGRYDEALDHLHRALAISRKIGDRGLEIETLNTLGETLQALGQPELALAHHRAAADLADAAGERFELARAVDGGAGALEQLGDRDEACSWWRRALGIYAALGVPETERVRERLAA
jgi:tetratricopeptide (TPR) repeat protein